MNGITGPLEALSHGQWVNQVIEWGHQGGWRVYAIADSRSQHWATHTGWPDVFLADESGRARGAMAIECKTGSGRERYDQKDWRVVLQAAGVFSAVAYPCDAEWLREKLFDGIPVREQVMRASIRKSSVKRRPRHAPAT